MKTSEVLPKLLGSAHTVPNHMLLLTLKRTLLIGAAVENLKPPTGGPKTSRCRVMLFSPTLVISALQCFSLEANNIQLNVKYFLESLLAKQISNFLANSTAES